MKPSVHATKSGASRPPGNSLGLDWLEKKAEDDLLPSLFFLDLHVKRQRQPVLASLDLQRGKPLP